MTAKLQQAKPVFVVEIDNRKLYATHLNLRWGARGKVLSASKVLASLTKGEARKVRKALFKLGFRKHAAALRNPCTACGKRSACVGNLCGICNRDIPF